MTDVPRIGAGRFTKAAQAAWEAWWMAGGVAESWSPAEVEQARRLARMIDREERSEDPDEQTRLASSIRTLSRDLRILELPERKRPGRPKPRSASARRCGRSTRSMTAANPSRWTSSTKRAATPRQRAPFGTNATRHHPVGGTRWKSARSTNGAATTW